MAWQMNGWEALTLSKGLMNRIRSSYYRLIQGAIFSCIVFLGASIVRSFGRFHTLRRLLSCFWPRLQYCRQSLADRGAHAQPGQPDEAAEEVSYHEINHSSSYHEEFKVSVTSHNALCIEIFDGGICLESGDDDIRGDSPLTRIQETIVSVMLESETPIEKLDLFASHFRACLTSHMMEFILQVLPPLKHLQLGGLCLSVEELCRTLTHPSLRILSHLALYDLVFLGSPVIDTTINPTLPLEEIVAVFIRLEDQDVTLDPLLNFLQSAPSLRQFELVMDHSHAYVHGYSRQEQSLLQQTLPKQLFSPDAFSRFLNATSNNLELLFLEYVSLTTQHYRAIAEHGKSITQLRLRDDPEIAGRIADADRLQSLASLLRHHSSLQTVTLDGLWTSTQKQESVAIFEVLPLSGTITSVRLRSLPMQIVELKKLLCNNETLQNLSLHNVAFPASTSPTLEDFVDEEMLFVVLVQILKSNSTLRRITWKQSEFRRTEVFPRHRKPRSYRCFQQQPQQLTPQQQLHWYLTLNQRGIRYLLVDLDCSRSEFLDLLIQQQRSPSIQMCADLPADSKLSEKLKPGKGNIDDDTQGYALDCLYHMLSNNPSLCR